MPARSAPGTNRDDTSRNLASMEAMLQRLMALPAAPGETPVQSRSGHSQGIPSEPIETWSPSSSTWGPLAEVWKSGGQPESLPIAQAEMISTRPERQPTIPPTVERPLEKSVPMQEQRTWLSWFNDALDDLAAGMGPVGRFISTTPGHWLLTLAGIGFWCLAAYILTGGTIPWPSVGNLLD